MMRSKHILERHGVKWPPGFFTGQAGCFWCESPPPPPPPPEQRFYYYALSRCTCTNCGVFGLLQNGTRDDYAACSWQIEVDGFTSMAPPGCGAGSACTANNGTFILTRTTAGPNPTPGDGFVGNACRWASPTFTATAIQPQLTPPPVQCPVCSTNQGMRYEIWIQKSLSGLKLMLKLIDIVNNTVSAQWEKTIGPLTCAGSHTLDLVTAYTHLGVQACCQNAPLTVDVLPL